MEKNFEKELPAGFREVYTVNARDKKVGIIFNVVAVIITSLISLAAGFIIRPEPRDFFGDHSVALIRNIVFVIVMILYVVLHELTHGLAYKLLTGQKLKFGVSLTVAFCGVPEIYVYRRASLIAVLAPFTVFSVVFLCAVLLLGDPWNKMYAAIIFAYHVGGCSGDLWNTFLYLTRFRDPETLTRDTGPVQSFYQRAKQI